MKKAWLVIELIFAFAAVLLILMACNYMFPKRVDHDIWDILTAVGTVGAAVAAVWIATNETRRRRKTDLEIAELTAAAMGFRLTYDHAIASRVAGWMDGALHVDRSAEDFLIKGRELESLCLWSASDLLPLVPLPRLCAMNLAAASDQVRLCEKILINSGVGTHMKSPEGRKDTATTVASLLQEACRQLQIGIDECVRAAKKLDK
jgi:hypothetical protein